MNGRQDHTRTEAEKRGVKRASNKHHRHQLKRALAENPDDAANDTPDVGRHRSAEFNEFDREARRKPTVE